MDTEKSSSRGEPHRSASVTDSIRGQLLIAGPALQDPNFWRTVVLVVEHTEEGALGLVLNRPSETTVGDAVPQLEEGWTRPSSCTSAARSNHRR